MVDTLDLKSNNICCVGSSPTVKKKYNLQCNSEVEYEIHNLRVEGSIPSIVKIIFWKHSSEVEQLPFKQLVVGSIPTVFIKKLYM